MTRIRYKKIGEWLYSQDFLCGTSLVHISIDLTNLIYYINKPRGTIKEGRANTLTSLKKKAKLAVVELGAAFYQEVRNRGKTERFEV